MLAGRVVVGPLQCLRRKTVVRPVAHAHEREAAVVGRVRSNRNASPVPAAAASSAPAAAEAAPALRHQRRHAAPEDKTDEHGRDDREAGAGPTHGFSFFAFRSRIAFVFSAISVSSFSICASYLSGSIDAFSNRS